jgi:hypothetical protein
MDISDPRQDPLGDIVTRVPDNIRAEMTRRRTNGEALAALINISYATFKRRMNRPGEFTVRDLVEMASNLRVPVLRLFEIDREAPR